MFGFHTRNNIFRQVNHSYFSATRSVEIEENPALRLHILVNCVVTKYFVKYLISNPQ